jgi:hypothetical protein
MIARRAEQGQSESCVVKPRDSSPLQRERSREILWLRNEFPPRLLVHIFNKTHPLQELQQTARSIASIESTLIKVRRTLDTDDE